MAVAGSPAKMNPARRRVRGKSVRPRVVALGGGTGLPAVLEGLVNDSERADCDVDALTAVVTVTDDGGSSGRLREQFNVHPPGDVRNCLVALAERDSRVAQFLQHRFEDESGRPGHAVGNLLLTSLTQIGGDFCRAVEQVAELIGARGRVLPTTDTHVRLRAEFDSGHTLTGERVIVDHPSPIRRLTLEPSPRPLPQVLQALVNADVIVVGPGSLYTSVLPNLLVEGLAATLSGVDAVRVYVANLMTEPGETDRYTLDDHLRVIRAHTGYDLFDYILVNRAPIDATAAARYRSQGAEPVVTERRLQHAGTAQLVEADLAMEAWGAKIRHNPASLARAILSLAHAGRVCPVAIAI